MALNVYKNMNTYRSKKKRMRWNFTRILFPRRAAAMAVA